MNPLLKIPIEREPRAIAVVLLPGVIWFGCCQAPARAADWPQFLGPERNGVPPETGLLQKWPKDGPPLVWSRPVGEGYSGPVIAGERLILFHRVGNEEVVECLDPATGKN